jgi:hypothetical protein
MQTREEVVKLEAHADYRPGAAQADKETEERRKKWAAQPRIPRQANDPPQ